MSLTRLRPIEGDDVPTFLTRCMEQRGRTQSKVAELATSHLDGLGGAGRITQSLISDLIRGAVPPRTLHGRETASNDPRYRALARAIDADEDAFVRLVEQAQLLPASGGNDWHNAAGPTVGRRPPPSAPIGVAPTAGARQEARGAGRSRRSTPQQRYEESWRLCQSPVEATDGALRPDDTPDEVRSLLRRWTITGRITRVRRP